MSCHLKTFFYYCIVLMSYYIFCSSAYADVQTKLSRDKLAQGETVTITYNLGGLTNYNIAPDFTPLEKEFHIIGTNYRTAINIINGVTQSQMIWELTLQPKMIGEVIIPEINFGKVKSTPQKITVLEATSALQKTDDNDSIRASVFVQAFVDNTSPIVQSQVIYTFKLFYRTQLENPTIETPHVANATLIEIGDDQSYQTIIKGEPFLVFEKKFAIFPQQPGKLVIPPAHFRAIKFNLNRGLFDDPFAIPNTQPVTLATRPYTLDVKAIPSTYQNNSWLPAKNITLSEKWSADSNHWEVGNPITRTITIKALGLRADQIPDFIFDHMDHVSVYTEKPQRKNNIQGNDILGVWQQKITYIPNQTQNVTLPALILNWWNTQTRTEAQAELKAKSVQVAANAAQSQSTTSASLPANAAQLPVETPNDLRGATMTAKIFTENQPFYFSIWFWISVALFVIWLLTLWRMRKKVRSVMINTGIKVVATHKSTAQPRKKITTVEKKLAAACEAGDAKLAQRLILAWAKTKWQDPPQNLEKLAGLIDDTDFKVALKNLEQALYTDKIIDWDANTFLKAYSQIFKTDIAKRQDNNQQRKTKVHEADPLPPLNP